MDKKTSIILIISSLLIGGIVGGIDYLFGSVLLGIGDFRTANFTKLIGWLPLIGLVIVYLYQRFGKEVSKGMTLLFDVHENQQTKISPVLVPLIIISTWLTHLFGGSAGREGVAVQIGGTVGNFFSRYLPIKSQDKEYRQLYLMIGMAAGFGGLFQTPLTATVFAYEVFRTSAFQLKRILLVLISAYTSFFVTSRLGLEKFKWHLASETVWGEKLSLIIGLKWLLLMLSLFVIGKLFAFVLKKVKSILAKKIPNPYIKIFVLGMVLAALVFVLKQGRYAGLGTNLIEQSFSKEMFAYDWLLKMLLTIFTLSIGFQGGEVTPLFSIGASFANVFSKIIGLPMLPAVALGYVGVFSSASNTFLTGVLLSYEVFGLSVLPLVLCQTLLFMVIRRDISIYPITKR